MLLNIERVKPTAKSLVLSAGGKDYFAKKDSGLSVGMSIDAETEDSDYNGKSYTWIKKWKPIQGEAHRSAAAAVTPAVNPQGIGQAPWWMPFVSNCCAHAIQSGHCETPAGIKLWAMGAKEAARALVTQTPSTQNEDIPF